MTFDCFGKPIKRTCLYFSICLISVAIIVTLIVVFVLKHKVSHAENDETTTTMITSVSTNSKPLISNATIIHEMTTSITTNKPETSADNLLYWTNNLSFARSKASFGAVVFSSGHVMACGGYRNVSIVTSECDVYSPSTGWLSGPAMRYVRYNYTLTLFANNTKLLAAGNAFPGYQQTAEVLNSTNNTWVYTSANMTTARHLHAAILLKNEQILIMGGKNNSGVILSSAELFIPSSDSFISTNPMNVGRAYFASTLLNDGSTVLITGGIDMYGNMISAAELYASNSWTFINKKMMQPRAYHAAILLQDGTVLIAGGGNRSSVSYSTAEIYNPTTGTFTRVGSMTYRRALFTLTLLPTGKVLATGGVDWITKTYPVICELYNPITQTWSNTEVLNTGRYFHQTVLLNDLVLTMGGIDSSQNYLASCEKYYL